ncbi:MAG: dephospho-CoA kinase [Oscillospiraceae bacterium]|nr:dephospho-CoA kinase [Oscillospiraceae bacterium]
MSPKCGVIGLTGGSGSGKSEAAKVLSGLGAAIIDADRVAREISNEPQTLAALKAELGGIAIDKNGMFARKRVAALAFKDREFMRKLTGVTHQFIVERIKGRIREIKETTPERTIVIDAPIPVEHGFLDQVDEVWVVRADLDERLRRIVSRDGIHRAEAEARVGSQLTDAEYEKVADRLIDNNGSLLQLKEKLEAIWNSIV